MTSLLAELKRRNVIRVAAAYIVVGWVVLQVAEFIAPLLQLPDWTVSLALYLGIIGFPFALIFAWAFELTPEGLKLTAEVDKEASITRETGKNLNRAIFGLMAVAILLLLAERFYLGAGLESTVAEADSGEAPKSIAVLPFVNMSGDPDQEYFSDGISEELLNGLAKLSDLHVAARASSFAFKSKDADIKSIGDQLNVETVLDGSVRKAGTRVRITAQLINVEDGYNIWSETYDRELTDIFAIQDEISRAIVEALRVHLAEGEAAVSHRAVNPDAYNFYLQAQDNLRRRNDPALQLAIRQYQKAIDIEPDYAEAWAGQAAATKLLSEEQYGTVPEKESHRRAQALLDRAFEIEPDLPRALAVQALLDLDGNPYTALESIDTAIAANPSEGILYTWKSGALHVTGRTNEADQTLEQAFRLDPLHPATLTTLAMRYVQRGNLSRARELVTPGTELAYRVEAFAARTDGRWADAVIARQRAMELTDGGIDHGLAYYLAFEMYLFLREEEAARAVAPPVFRMFIDAMENPDAFLQRMQQIPADQRSNFLEDIMVLALLRLDRCEGVLEVYAGRNYLDENQRLWGDTYNTVGNVSNAAQFGWCLKQLGRTAEALALGQRLEQFIENAVAYGQSPVYFFNLAQVQLLQDKQDAAMGSLKLAWQHHVLEPHFLDMLPIMEPLRNREDFRALRAAIYDHTNAERAKLGWDPIEISALD